MSSKPILAGIAGWPVSQSLSPALHGFWLREHQINGFYVPLAIRREDFSDSVRGLQRSGFAGINVTIPHKEAAFAIAHTHDDASLKMQAANLLLFDGHGAIRACNTDSAGLKASLEESLGASALRNRKAIVAGAGGAARATICCLDALGLAEIFVLNRTAARAQSLVRSLSTRVNARLSAGGFETWQAMAPSATLLVNATSTGTLGSASLPLDLNALPGDASVCDLVYNPVETLLLRDARRLGLRTVGGLGMLMHQAVPSFEALFGQRPQVTQSLRDVLVGQTVATA